MIPFITPTYHSLDDDQQVIFASKIVQKMSTNSRFEFLLPHVQDLSIHLAEWQIATTKAKKGGKIKAIKRIEKGLTVKNSLHLLAKQVEIFAQGNAAVIQEAGFEIGLVKKNNEQKPQTIEQEELWHMFV